MYIGHVTNMSFSGYRDRRFEPRLHLYVMPLSKTLDPHCFNRLSCEMSTRGNTVLKRLFQCYDISIGDST